MAYTHTKKIERTSAGLRDALFESMEQLRAGDIEAQDAKAMAALAREIVNTVHLEVEVARLKLQHPAETKKFVPAPLQLGVKDEPINADVQDVR